ncbi:MAG TPA: MG2 domain-containing protein [Bacteroidales bacterium]|nr:MG2 domain-containing protein [Bacteroidales bacterium]
MKNTKIIYWISGIALAATILIVVISMFRGEKKFKLSNPELFKEYITAYTGEVISKNDVIAIQLTDQFFSSIDKKKTNIIEVYPKVKGTVSWKDNNIVEFKPDKPLESGKTYIVTFNLEKLNSDIDKSAQEFVFRVQTKHQVLNVQIDRITTTDRQDFKKQDVFGKIILNDSENIEDLKKCLSASISGDDLNIEIEKATELEYIFSIKNITRGNKDQTLKIKYDGSTINSKSVGETELKVPPLDEFCVLDIQVNQFPEQYINILFSDPVKEDQLLEGLISLSDVENLKYIIMDNNVKVIPTENLTKSYNLKISKSVVNIHNKKLDAGVTNRISFAMRKPELSLSETGVIIPTTTEGQVVSFKAVNIKAVDVRIIKIFENNILQFLQDNSLSGGYNLNRVGKVVKNKTISLEQTDVEDFGEWNTFYLNLSDIVETDPGAIYRIEIGFRKENAIYPCGTEGENNTTAPVNNMIELNDGRIWSWFTDYSYTGNYGYEGDEEYYYEDYYYDEYYYDDYSYDYDYEYGYDEYDYYSYRTRNYNSYDDPCNNNYYGYRRSIKFNLLASDIGLICKKGKDDKIYTFVTNLLTAEAISSAKVEVYNYQQQVIGTSSTDYEGKAVIEIPANDKAFFVVASYNNQKSYLKLEEYGSLNTSGFDVSGEFSQDGTKAFIYTERGVWRPGDSIYVGFILNELMDPIPTGHPIVFEVYNPKNQEIYHEVQKKNEKGFHVFKFKTEKNDPTGYYYAKFTIGGKVFTKSLMVETIRPNRLNIDLSLDKGYLTGDGTVNALIKATWLHGADAVDLNAEVSISLSERYSPFDKYTDYNFYNQMNSFDFTTQSLFNAKTDNNGEIKTPVKFDKVKNAPGVLNAALTTKVFEKSGEFSIGETNVIYYPYKAFIGIKIRERDKYSYSLPINKELNLDIIAVDPDQKLAKDERQLELSIYMIEYSWWYDYQYDGADYITANYNNAISRKTLRCKNGKISDKLTFEDNGDYLIVVKDFKDGHTSSMRVYASNYASSGSTESEAIDKLSLTSDKENYNVGDNVKIDIPCGTGKALVSIENSFTVLKTFWVESNGNNLEINFEATSEMAPNVYVNVSFIQKHSQTGNDLPIRMYGIIPILVEDPATHLYPIIKMQDELLAESKVLIQIREQSGKPMTYTLAMVDEGLLNITKFNTPDPWAYFYSKGSLGVRTWDIFDFVVGAFTIDAGKMLSIGGGDNEMSPEELLQATRFKPMVKFIGPITLAPGAVNTHSIQLPQYIGSVRTMVIAAEGNSFGSAEKTTPVKKPLMILGSAPRKLGTNESFSLPITVFAMKSDVKNVSINVKTNGLLSIDGQTSKTLNFTKEGEKYVFFNLKSGTKTGVASIEITATSGSHVSKYNIEMDISHANAKMTDVIDGISSNDEYRVVFDAFGIEGTNETFLELYSIPPLNLEARLHFLTTYPHGCLEQSVSAAFPQLYLESLMELTAEQKADIQKNVNACINKLQRFQMPNGGFAYWPGGRDVSEWATNYAGHFMIEAEKLGYTIPGNVKSNWINYQKQKASKWTDDGNMSQMTQAYRLYTLALAGQPDKSAMNRLKEAKISNVTTWRLAGAYTLCGKESIAKQMISNLSTEVKIYFELSGTYGSDIRDKAMILETLTELGEKEKAFMVLRSISEYMGTTKYASTQTTAYALMAASKFVKKYGSSDKIDCNYTLNGKNFTAKSGKPVYKTKLDVPDKEKNEFILKTTDDKMLFIRIIRKGIPLAGNETEASSNIKMTVNYTYPSGNPIDVTNIPQGTDFIATITLTNTSGYKSLDNVALSQIFPSGWEIINSRLFTVELGQDSYFTYQDIRDDRVLTYLNMYKNSVYTYRVMLNATYEGKYYLPATICETMYDDSNYARTKGTWVNVTKL